MFLMKKIKKFKNKKIKTQVKTRSKSVPKRIFDHKKFKISILLE
jgi:hypothetical protein